MFNHQIAWSYYTTVTGGTAQNSDIGGASGSGSGEPADGRLDHETTANVGTIEGGPGGTNVVPDRCRFLAETRSLDPERAAEIAGKMSDACAWGASEHGCDVDVRLEELFRGYQLPTDSPALGLAEAGLRGAGLEPARVTIGGGSDVNAFRRDGHDSVLLSNGTDNVHTENEFVPAANLVKMLAVCEGIVGVAANGGATGEA